ncbi:hypothetical protein CYLTODRAFT_386946 [Cylindrobasidium torrendii FP15055 ss-10]|uniref:Exonuclease domain-containing protein n=1 Tax=Cylindrobasidium torrendii FP15055 ss-10 TaxID=1314674 RepID=A0A0D7BS40_9AGAR|nr:hypothetical protein CYLTODRAFT_386946 [Cylindrobasidium torrendii FP15055 ss-10]
MKRSHDTSAADQEAEQQNKKRKVDSDAEANAEEDANDGWTKVDKRKKKKAKRAVQRAAALVPKFMYSQTDIVNRVHAVGIEDIRDLAVHIVADAPPPNWLRIEHASLVPRVVVLFIPGLTNDLLGLPPTPTSAMQNPNIPISIPLPPKNKSDSKCGFPFIASTFSHACPTRAPGDSTRMHSILNAFFSIPLSVSEKGRRHRQAKEERPPSSGATSEYLLSTEQMLTNGYPLPSYVSDTFHKPAGWVETPKEPDSTGSQAERKVYAIDCEMCMTDDDDKALTRVSIVDYDTNKVVYDRLVKPARPIVNYLTQWSGITEEALRPVKTTIAEVQADVLKFLQPQNGLTPVLLGHSLESDLKALHLCHPYCIDTALIFQHPRGAPLKPGLAWLTNKYVGREIQNRGDGGHDPEEDARACVDLLKRKVKEGPAFGMYKVDCEGLFERLARATKRAGGGSGSIRTAVVDHGDPTAMHGAKANTSIGCKDDSEVLSQLMTTIPSHNFVFGRFMALANVLGWITPKVPSQPPTAPSQPPPREIMQPVMDELNNNLKTLHASLPPRTALLIFTGHSDPRAMSLLNARKYRFEQAIRSGKESTELGPEDSWSSADMRELEHIAEITKRGLLFIGVKP